MLEPWCYLPCWPFHPIRRINTDMYTNGCVCTNKNNFSIYPVHFSLPLQILSLWAPHRQSDCAKILFLGFTKPAWKKNNASANWNWRKSSPSHMCTPPCSSGLVYGHVLSPTMHVKSGVDALHCIDMAKFCLEGWNLWGESRSWPIISSWLQKGPCAGKAEAESEPGGTAVSSLSYRLQKKYTAVLSIEDKGLWESVSRLLKTSFWFCLFTFLFSSQLTQMQYLGISKWSL